MDEGLLGPFFNYDYNFSPLRCCISDRKITITKLPSTIYMGPLFTGIANINLTYDHTKAGVYLY